MQTWFDSELLFVGDAGTTEASRPSRRYGVEWANYYNMTKHLTRDADFSFSHAEFRDNDIDSADESRVRPGDTPLMQIHFHPVEPIQARFTLTRRF